MTRKGHIFYDLRTLSTIELWALCTAAEELGTDEMLNDPTDTDILIYAAELAEVERHIDLGQLSAGERKSIIRAYDGALIAPARFH